MKLYTIALLLLSFNSMACGDHFYGKLGFGINKSLLAQDVDYEWKNPDDIAGMFAFGYRHNISGNWYGDLNYSHYSQWLVGPLLGLNRDRENDPESVLDHFGYNIEYRF